MFAALLRPKVDFACLILRFALASIFVVHGYFKIVQLSALTPYMTLEQQTLVGWTELIAGVMLAIGFMSRLAALANIPIQICAIVLVTGKYALRVLKIESTGADYMRVGPEYNLVLIAMCLAVMVLGSGYISVDHCLLTFMRRKKAQPAPSHSVPVGG